MLQAEGINILIPRADIHDAIHHRWRANYNIASLAPEFYTRGCIQRVHVIVIRADINHPIRHSGRRFHIAAGGVVPQHPARAGIQRVHPGIERADIDHTVRDGRGGQRIAGVILVRLAEGSAGLAAWR